MSFRSGLGVSACGLFLAIAPTHGAVAPAAAPAAAVAGADHAAKVHHRLSDLGHALAAARDRLARDAASPSTRHATAQALARHLTALEAATAASIPMAQRGEIDRKLAQLRPLLADLERPPAATAPPASHTRWVVAAEHATCGTALPLAAADHVRGDTGEKAGGAPAGEVWFRLSGERPFAFLLDSRGSRFDTELAVFDRCGATRPIAANDDFYGLTSRVQAQGPAAGTRYVRLSGYDGTSGLFELTASASTSYGVISGRVTSQSSGAAISGSVYTYDATGHYVGSTYINSDGVYVTAVAPGSYFVATSTYRWIDEVYDDVPCHYSCVVSSGTPVVVQADQLTSGIDFALSTGASIAGWVHDAAGGSPPVGQVIVARLDGGDGGTATIDDAGRWRVDGLLGGTYAVYTASSTHEDQLWMATPCGATCDPASGTPVTATRGSLTSDIDFTLTREASISGTMTGADTGAPVTGYVHVEGGSAYKTGVVDDQGHWSIGGLVAGSYVAWTQADAYRDETWRALPCPGGYCPTTPGTPIDVADHAAVAGIDFVLQPLGVISGTVTFAHGGGAVAGADVSAEAAGAGGYDSTYADSSGLYRLRLPDGDYRVDAADQDRFRPAFAQQLYRGINCNPDCNPDSATLVTASGGTTRSGIDFAVARTGSIAGTITDRVTLQPLQGAWVGLFDGWGDSLGWTTTDSGGHYRLTDIATDTYFLSASESSHVTGIYRGISCSIDCYPETGTPIAVTLEAVLTGIDLALTPDATLGGTLRDAATGATVSGTVEIWTASGTPIATTVASSAGSFTVQLAPGTYVALASSPAYRAQLYSGIACPGGIGVGCTAASGTPISLAAGGRSGVDFALTRLGRIAGTLRCNPACSYPPSGDVTLYDGNGVYLRSVYSYGGAYSLDGLEPGTYYAVASGYGLVDELFDKVSCRAGCDPRSGKPIQVTLGGTSTADFVLDRADVISGRVVDMAGNPLRGVAIDFWNSWGNRSASTVTDADGRYQQVLSGDGGYSVSTDNDIGYTDQVWDGIVCAAGSAWEGLCDPARGWPVSVSPSSPAATGIDFHLGVGTIFESGFEHGFWLWVPPG